MEKKNYSIRVVPEIKKVNDPENEGATITKAVFIRKSKPDEKAVAKNFKPEDFLHLELFQEDPDDILGGDTKAHTLVLFANSNRILFDKLAQLIEEGAWKELSKKSKVIKMTNTLPGLLVTMVTKPYYATRITNEGKRVPLKANRRNPDTGDFESESVIMGKISFFLFSSQVSDEGKAVQLKSELNRIHSWVKGASDEKVATAEVVAKAEEDDGEAPE